MSYTKQTWATGDIITASKLNHIEDGIENSDYDLIIATKGVGYYDFSSLLVSDIEIVRGDILDLEDKLDNGEPVNGVFICYESPSSYNPTIANTGSVARYFKMEEFNGYYAYVTFSNIAASSTNVVTIRNIIIGYDHSTGEIATIATKSKVLS